MADQSTPEQTDQPGQPGGVDAGKVIDKLTGQIGAQARELAVTLVLMEEQAGQLAEARRIIDRLRADLVAATSAHPAPASATGSGRP